MAEEKEKKKSKTVIYIVIAVIAIIVVFVIAGSNSDLTVYPVTCTDWFTNNTLTPPAVQDFSNCHHPEAMERETFHVDTTKNEITLTHPIHPM